MDGVQSPALTVAVVTAGQDAVGGVSPLVGLPAERLAPLMGRRGCRVVGYDLQPGRGARGGYLEAADQGRGLGERWVAASSVPDVVLCDGFLSAAAGHAAAGRTGAQVVLWLGTEALPRDLDELALATAVSRSAAAVFVSCAEVALRLRRSRITDRIDVVPSAVEGWSVREPAPWRLRGDELPAPHDLTVAVCAAAEPTRADRQIVGLVERSVPTAQTLVVGGGASPALPEGVDVAVTGLVRDGGRTTLRAMAAGVAVVSLPLLPDRDLIEHRASGLTTTNAAELRDALRELDEDVFLREALAQGAVDQVRARHAPKMVTHLLLDRLIALVEPTRARLPGQRPGLTGPDAESLNGAEAADGAGSLRPGGATKAPVVCQLQDDG